MKSRKPRLDSVLAKREGSWGDTAIFGGVVLSGLVFLFYLSTLAPTVVNHDSASFQAKAYVLGTVHPTGYPTYLLLSKLFTYLPFGDVGYRVNLFSAVCASLLVFFVYLVALKLSPGGGLLRPLCAAVGALAFALSPMLWSQAVVAEVYALNALFIAAVFFVLLSWREKRRDGLLLLAAFLLGLSLTHHLTSGLLLPAAFLFVALTAPRKLLEWRFGFKGAALFLLALTPYLYLPVRDSMVPHLTGTTNSSTLEGFLTVVSGERFKGAMFIFGPSELPGRVAMYLTELSDQFPLPLLAVALVGAAVLVRRDRAAFALFAVVGGGYFVYGLEYAIPDIAVYFIPTYLVASLLLSVGLSWLTGAARGLLGRGSVALGRAVPAALLALALLALALGVAETLPEVDESDNRVALRTIRAVSQNTAPGASVLVAYQDLTVLRYMQFVQGKRRDLKLISVDPETVDERSRVALTKAALKEGPTYYLRPDPAFAWKMEQAEANLKPSRSAPTLFEVPRR